MPEIVDEVMDARINIDVEFQGWLLLFATVTAVWLFCLPCYCAGLSSVTARSFAVWVSQRLPAFYLFMTLFNLTFLFLVCQWLPDWTPTQYAEVVAKTMASTAEQLLQFATSIAMIVAFCIVVAFKDRFAQLFGLDTKVLFRCKVRDCLSCWSTARFRPIELSIWKVDELASADMFAANNVFVEIYLGYNESMRTRVHNNAGSHCFLKESLQLNFDADDDEETLYIFVKNQKVMGTQELGRQELTAEKLQTMIRGTQPTRNGMPLKWSADEFMEIQLMPRGKIWLRVANVVDDELEGGLMQDLVTC